MIRSLLVVALIASPVLAQREFGFDNTKSSGQPYLKPEETVARMKVADGFEVKLFAAEPQLVNPIAMTVDEKGRVWVVECFEYPKRTAKGKMPRDRVKILEDTDGDGVCDKVTTFIEGKDFPVPFDLASGIEVGNGGIYLGAPPYLFFIENKDDKPGKIEILLKGFGSQDTHETLNTFQWGPDGRLYGLHGIFTYSEVKPAQGDGPGTRINACVWRYDTKTKKFEVFSEGTSNPWGMDWRNTDGQFILCCCVIPHLFHMVPGGNYKRQAGQSDNPYAYGEIKEICDHTFHKESGWAHAGLISLDTPLMPEKYRNSVIFGSIHGCSLKQNILKPNGSSYTASRGDDFLVSGDKNFRPINLRWGPNGEIYCIDWHDQNPCHQTKPDDWDYARGRVYRIQPKGLKTGRAVDLAKKTDSDLLDAVEHDNPYINRTAMRLVRERGDKFDRRIVEARFDLWDKIMRTWAVKERAFAVMRDTKPPIDYEKLSDEDKLGTTAGLMLAAAGEEGKTNNLTYLGSLLDNLIREIGDNPTSQTWVVGELLPQVAERTKSAKVRRELCSIAVRSNGDRTRLVHALLKRGEDADDPLIPQLLWVAYEKMLVAHPELELAWVKDNLKDNALLMNTVVPRGMRRLIASGNKDHLVSALTFLGESDSSVVRRKAIEAIGEAIGNRTIEAPQAWKLVRADLAKDSDPQVRRLADRLAVKFADGDAIKKALAVAEDAKAALADRLAAVRDVGVARLPNTLSPMLKLATGDSPTELRIEAIRALAGYDAPTLGGYLLADFAKLDPAIKNEVVQVLSGRKEWAKELLAAVEARKVDRRDLNDNTILRIQALKDNNLNGQVEKVWGRMRATPAELNQLIDKMRGELAKAPGSFDRGKVVFDNQCAKCHKFDGRGHEVGPNIEGAGRDIEYLLTNVLDPNRVIGAPYFLRSVVLNNQRVETGVLHAEDDQSITLKGENGVLKQIQKNDIDDLKVVEKSLMPEGLTKDMKEQDFRDLVRYAMANPFLTKVSTVAKSKDGQFTVHQPVVGVPGRIPLPDGDWDQVKVSAFITAPADMTARLLIGSKGDFTVTVDKATVKGKGAGVPSQPDQTSVEVKLVKGTNEIELTIPGPAKGDAVYLRFHDPDRKLRYPE